MPAQPLLRTPTRMSLGPDSDSINARRRKTAVGVSLSAAVRERNLVPRSAAAFFGAVVEGEADFDADAEASGMEAATLGSLASSAALAGVKLDEGAGSEALGAGVAGDGVGADSCAAATLGSFCDFGEAGEEGESVAHAGSTLAVSVLSARLCWEVDGEDPDEDEDANGGACEDDDVEVCVAFCNCAFDEDAGDDWLTDVESHRELGMARGEQRTRRTGEEGAFSDALELLDAKRRAEELFVNKDALHLATAG